jgi:hypothetical protein
MGTPAEAKLGAESFQIRYEEGRVGFTGGYKLRLHAEMDRDTWPFKPTPAPSQQWLRLGHFGQAEQVTVKSSSFGLATGRHGYLDMVKGKDLH